MKFPLLLLSSLTCAALLGCQGTLANTEGDAPSTPWVGDAVRRAAVERAIVVQHTLYAYHFVDGAAELNALGAKDLAVLAEHFRQHGGQLNLRRANAPAQLFDARVAAITKALTQAGVTAGRVTVADGLPGGDGMLSERVIAILAKPSVPLGGFGSTTTGNSVGAAAAANNNAAGTVQ